jgi:hypothetical protein
MRLPSASGGVCEVHATQYLQAGRFEKDARTSRHDARQSLEHAHFVPGPRQEHGGRETRNAAADDRYAQGMCPGRVRPNYHSGHGRHRGSSRTP